MKKLFIIASVLVITAASAQTGKVGINTTNPKASLDVNMATVNANTTTPEGILIPRVSRARLSAMGTGNAIETSTMVYVNDVSNGAATGTTVDVTAVGFYFYNGTKWVSFNSEPWKVIETNEPATLNTQNIYQRGDILSTDDPLGSNMGGNITSYRSNPDFGSSIAVLGNPFVTAFDNIMFLLSTTYDNNAEDHSWIITKAGENGKNIEVPGFLNQTVEKRAFEIVEFGDNTSDGQQGVRKPRFRILSATISPDQGLIPQVVEINKFGSLKANGFTTYAGGNYPDYVFQKYYYKNSPLNPSYEFKSLDFIENFTKENGHLPGYPSYEEVKAKDEVNLSQQSMTNQEKIEELFLHVIELNKKIKEQEAKIKSLESKLQN